MMSLAGRGGTTAGKDHMLGRTLFLPGHLRPNISGLIDSFIKLTGQLQAQLDAGLSEIKRACLLSPLIYLFWLSFQAGIA